MTDWNKPTPETDDAQIEMRLRENDANPGFDQDVEPLENFEDEEDIINDADDDPEEEDIPIVDAVENSRRPPIE